MRLVFLVEPLGDPDILAALAGDERLPTLERAILPGHVIRADSSGTRLTPFRSPEDQTEGWLIRPDERFRERLDFWMTATGTQIRVAKVGGAGGHVLADAYLLPADQATVPWTRSAWDGEWRATVTEAIRESMCHFGEVEAEDMPDLMLGIGYRALARARGAADRTPVALRVGMAADRDIEPLRFQMPYARYFAVEEHTLRHRRFDGSMSGPILRAAFGSGDAVTVLPFDPRTGTVLLIEQFRAGPHARRDPRPWCLETVAGRCDPMEGAEETVRREALEEAGLTLGRIERIASYYPSPGIMAEHITAFVGEADLGAAGGRHGLASEDEDIRSMVLPLEEALAAVASGEVNNAPLLISLLWLEKNATRLRQAWT